MKNINSNMVHRCNNSVHCTQRAGAWNQDRPKGGLGSGGGWWVGGMINSAGSDHLQLGFWPPIMFWLNVVLQETLWCRKSWEGKMMRLSHYWWSDRSTIPLANLNRKQNRAGLSRKYFSSVSGLAHNARRIVCTILCRSNLDDTVCIQ